jgi:hypothetical protein
MPADGWRDVAALLTSTGAPWPESAVVFDLRWHVDQSLALPGRPALVQRWHWTDRQVRALLADTARWWDPIRGEAPTDRLELSSHRHPGRRPAPVQLVSSSRPAPVQLDAESSASERAERPAPVQLPSSSRPAPVHTRGDPPSHSPPHSHGDSVTEESRARPREGSPPRSVDPLLVAELMALQLDEEPQTQETLQPPEVDRLAIVRALLRGTPPDTLRVLWAWSGLAGGEAEACRRGGWRRWSSLLSGDRGPLRIDMALAWDRAGRPRAGPAQPRRGGATSGDGVLEEVARRLAARREVGRG